MFLCPLVAVLMVMSAARAVGDPLCDPQTQYAEGETCCDMCAPGKRMSPRSTCSSPVCEDCNEDEYQDKYTREASCKRQPYCDPNKNFESPVLKNKTAKATCMCREGYHCSSSACITCARHSLCDPGYEVISKGNQKQDTICRPCQNGTFSSSTDGTCVAWTKCETGSYTSQSGTRKSDTVCVSRHRAHIIVGVVVAAALIMIGVVWYFFRGHLRRKGPPMVNGTNTTGYTVPDEGGFVVIGPCTPEEDDYPDISSENHRTENGNCVAQEHGKPDRLPRQESQQPPSSTQFSTHFSS